MLVSCVTQLVLMNVQPLCCLPPLGGSVAADTNAHIPTHPTPRLKPVSFRSCLMTRAWSMCSPLHLPLCALPGRRRSAAGGMMLGPCRALPQAEQKAKEEIAYQVFIPLFPLGPTAGLPRLVWYRGSWWLCRLNRVVVVLSSTVQHCAEGARIY